MLKISVIVPVYNAEKYLHYCVESVINQTYKNIELILVDDGSTDSSPELCDNYAEKYDFVKVFHKENGGQCSARNLGIKNASGDYISFVDNDDFVHPQYYEIMSEVAEKSECKICVCKREFLHDWNCVFSEIKNVDFEIINTKNILYDELANCNEYNFVSAFHTKLIKRDLFDKYMFNEDLRNEEDVLLISKFYSIIDKIAYISDELYFNVKNNSSITRDSENNGKNLCYLIKSRKYIIEFFKNKEFVNILLSNFIMRIIKEIGGFYRHNGCCEEFAKIMDYFISEFENYNITNVWTKYLFNKLKKKEYSFLYFSFVNYTIYKRYRRIKTLKEKIEIY